MFLSSIRHKPIIKVCIFVILLMVVLLYLIGPRLLSRGSMMYYLFGEDFLVNTKGCRIRKFDPFDPTIIQYYWVIDDPLDDCNQPSYLTINDDRIYLNQPVVENDFGKVSVQCRYTVIGRPVFTETSTYYVPEWTEPIPLEFGKKMTDDHLKLECFHENTSLFIDYVPLVTEKPDLEEKRYLAAKENLLLTPLNVIMIAVDSMSKLNFLRQFPKTYRYLKRVVKPFEFHGYTKVADNTFVNIVPLLTGHFVSYYRSFDNLTTTHYDDLDLVWKEYQRFGYWTLFQEDSPKIGTFTYRKLGFLEQPSDYSLRPTSYAADSDPWRKKNGEYCFGHVSETEFYYNYLREFLRKMHNRPSFAFTFISRISHDDINTAGFGDKPTLRLLQELYESGTLNKSVLIFFSDHGLRFGPILDSYIGKIEERMPFMFQYYPEWFLEKHDGFKKNLLINEHRLTTPFDVHKTLQNILTLSLKDGKTDEHEDEGHGLSLFEEIPPERTCADAYIAPHYCTCHDHYQVPNDDPKAIEAAQAIVQTLNKWITDGGHGNACAELQLKDIKDAYATVPQAGESSHRVFLRQSDNPYWDPEGLDHMYYLMTLKASPSDAVFSATVKDNNGTFTMFGDISRINVYGNQSWCVNDATMKKICYCTKVYQDS